MARQKGINPVGNRAFYALNAVALSRILQKVSRMATICHPGKRRIADMVSTFTGVTAKLRTVRCADPESWMRRRFRADNPVRPEGSRTHRIIDNWGEAQDRAGRSWEEVSAGPVPPPKL